MSTSTISLRLSGNLPPSDELTKTLGITPTTILHRGERVSKNRVQPVDIWSLELAKCDDNSTEQEINKQILEAAVVLQQMAPAIASLDRNKCNTDLYISTIREEDQGGLSLPAELIAAAAAAKLSIQISILVMLDDYEEPEAASINS
ncbi:DUF4279 domain-containing protein [Brasilonema sp. UFV-L1]|uniref:DUF4279 domain-containing protein n=1 Tax=Brasilonema sp. UFV-L1 TaxID=2234130 RepID=UPI00145D9542|nr:DUF4279 domain-containing protein [Brasilonema sp. UFV-L1]NMG10101.1 hypothetical protein [Brasilonema sp. UFV-L1]